MARTWVRGIRRLLASSWARMRRRPERLGEELSADDLAIMSEITKRVPDLLGAGRLIYPAERIVETIPTVLRMTEEHGFIAEYVGNWWVEGNPYKGINCTFLQTEGHGAGIVRFEVQFHTPESVALAKENHGLYEITRDENRPLRERQEAHDRMVASFASVPHPPGIEAIGEPVVKNRPISIREGQKAALDEARKSTESVAEAIAERSGGSVSISMATPEYPTEVEKLLDDGLDQLDAKDYAGALEMFDRAAALCSRSLDEWALRGAALATLRSGFALAMMGNYADAIARYDRVIDMSEDELGARTPGMGGLAHNAAKLKRGTLAEMEEP